MKAQIAKLRCHPPPFSKEYYIYKKVAEGHCLYWDCFYLLNNGQWSQSALPNQGFSNTPYDESKPHAYYSTIEEAEEILKKIGEPYEIIN